MAASPAPLPGARRALTVRLAGAICLAVLCTSLAHSQAPAPTPAAAQGQPATPQQLPGLTTLPLPAARGTATLPSTHPRILLNDTAYVEQLRARLKARTEPGQRFAALVDRQYIGQNVYGYQPWHSALIFRLSGMERYADHAVQLTEAFVAEEEARIARGEKPQVAGDSYLGVGDRIGNLALVYDWCHERMSPAQRARWLAYANQAVSNVWNPRTARWGSAIFPWTGWSVDNPANNYYYSFLRATLLLGLASHGENPQAEQWLQQFRQVKMEGQLLPLFERELVGGGSREGTGYGTALRGLWELYEIWQRSTGERLAQRNSHAQASIPHFLHQVVPTLDALAPVGDHARDSKALLFDYHRDYLLRLVALFPEDPASAAALALLEQSNVPRMRHGFNFVVDFLQEPPRADLNALQRLHTSYYGAGTGQLSMRSNWSREASFAHFICGPYTESHAHRDQGSFMLFKRQWLALDANLTSHSGLLQVEEAHNLVRFETDAGVVKQTYGAACQLSALSDDGVVLHATARITPAYRGKPVVSRLERELVFVRPDVLVVFDRAEASQPGVRRIWSLNLPAQPQGQEPLTLEQDGIRLAVHRLWPADAREQWVDWASLPHDPKKPGDLPRAGVRLDRVHEAGRSSRFLHLLSLDGAARQVQLLDTLPGQLGVRWTQADGSRWQVAFGMEQPGARLIREPAQPGAAPVDTSFPQQVQALPLLRAR